ncbi:MAG TPA: response regulator [Stellaceae bacterium]|nr:response regulator [Stellaceae bacterium]
MAVVMVIDDDSALRRLVQRALSGDGHEVIEAENGEEGLTLLQRHRPDLVVTDILMPKKEGIETISRMKEHHPAIKIIAMSGGGLSGNLMFLDVARALGVEATLAKPFRAAELTETVARVLGGLD